MATSKDITRSAGRFFCGVAVSIMSSSVTLAEEQSIKHIDVEGTSYAAYVQDDVVIAVPVPIQVRLVRDARQPAPPCRVLDERLASYREYIEDCKRSETASAGMCQKIKNIINALRTDPGTLDAPNLRQGWGIEAVLPAHLPSESTAKRKIAAATGKPASSVFVKTAVVAVDSPSNIGLHTKVAGSSSASALVGLMDIHADELSYLPDVQRFVTEDHVLACGILAGDVVPFWEQDVEIEVSVKQLLTSDDIYAIYTTLLAKRIELEVEGWRRYVRIGRLLDEAFRNLGVSGQDKDLLKKIDLAIAVLFEGDDLRIREGLTRDGVRQLLEKVSAPKTVTLTLPWKGVDAR